MKLIHQDSGEIVADSVELADSFVSRALGLLFRRGIARTHALVLFHTSSIHMFLMMFTIDVVFLDKDRRIVALFPRRRPFSFPVMAWSATYAVELAADRIQETALKIGDVLTWD